MTRPVIRLSGRPPRGNLDNVDFHVVPMGVALDTPDDELDMLALVTPEDIEAAKADGRARMGKRGAALLETAKTPPLEDEDGNTSDL